MSDEKIMPDEVFSGDFIDLFLATNKALGHGFKKTLELFGDTLTDNQKHCILLVYKSRKHIADTKIQDKAISILSDFGYTKTKIQERRLEAQRRIKIEKPSKARPVACFTCKTKPNQKMFDGGKYSLSCPCCGRYTRRYKKQADAIADWNNWNLRLEMESGQNPSKWGSDIASSRPIDRIAARVTKSHVGIKPIKLTEEK